jgi:hypothetical protein
MQKHGIFILIRKYGEGFELLPVSFASTGIGYAGKFDDAEVI